MHPRTDTRTQTEHLTPTVSVCVPNYNYARYLPQCLESVLGQTYGDFELVISDDASHDESPRVLEEYARRDPRVRWHRNSTRLGMNGNIKRAADSARGKYLKMLCADDWLAPQCLERLVDLMEANPRVVLATSAVITCDAAGGNGDVIFTWGRPVAIVSGNRMLDRMARGEGFGGHSSFLIRRSAYEEVGGYDPDLRYASDYDLGARLCRIGDYLHVDTPLFFGRYHPDASSAVNPAKLLDVPDWYEIAERTFRPRRFGNREWRRYERRTAQLTARYLVNVGLEWLRGRRDYARGLARLLRTHGNFRLGVPYLVCHVPARMCAGLAKLVKSGRASRQASA